MNEKIKKLAEQAEEYAFGEFHKLFLGNINSNNANWKTIRQELFNKKFAELIVKECMTQIQEVREIKAGHAGPEYTQGFDDGMFVALSTIEEHFGVEE